MVKVDLLINKWIFILFSSMLFLAIGCKDEVEDEIETEMVCDTLSVSYNNDIKIIVDNNCMPCHGRGQDAVSIPFDSHEELSSYFNPGQMIEYLETGYMPATEEKLSACEITKIRKWFEEGASNN